MFKTIFKSSNQQIVKSTIALFQRIVIILFLFTFTRILFYFFNTKYFSNISIVEFLKIFAGGIRFDISAVFVINLPFILLLSIPFRFRENIIYSKICKILFLIINSLALCVNCIDFIYFKFIFKRTTADFFSLFGMGDDMANTIPQMIKDFWYVALIWILLIVVMVYLYNKTKYSIQTTDHSPQSTKNKWGYYTGSTLVFIIVMLLTILGIRGGFQLKPINIITASRYANANNIPLVLNTPFTMIKTIKQVPLEKVKYFRDDNELRKVYDPVKNGEWRMENGEWRMNKIKNGDIKKINIVILILESFSKEHIGALNRQQLKVHSYTPFLDSLIGQSLVFPNSFANGRKSIEGIPAVLSGMPSLMNNPYISSPYAGNKFTSLADLLKKEGYNTAFYHGGTNGTMGFDNYAKAAGFDNYYGRYEYNNDKDFDSNWGIFDEPFLQYFAKSLDKTKQPFLAALFTLSSHHPYFIPLKYKNRFNRGNPLQRSLSYADYTLKEFFNTVSRMQWFDNTLFVITADHTSQVVNEELNNRLGAYEIPIIFYQHNSKLKGIDSTVTQQIDIMPSILDYINYNKAYFAFGNSIFASSEERRAMSNEQKSVIQNYKTHYFAINYLSDTYEIIDKNYVLQFDGKRCLGLYDRIVDPSLKHDISVKSSDKSNYLMLLLEGIIQTYNQRMIENKLTIDN